MIIFDRDLWWVRAQNRYKKQLGSNSSKLKYSKRKTKSIAENQLSNDAYYIGTIATVIDWCNTKKINVFFGKSSGGLYDVENRLITISGRASPEKQLFMILHECGHHLIGYHEDDIRFGKGYPLVNDPRFNVSFHHRLACLEEEIEAWNRGWNLASRLRINLDRNAFDKTRIDCLRGYVKWTNSRSTLPKRKTETELIEL